MAERDVFVQPDTRRSGAGYVNPSRMRAHPEFDERWVCYVLFKTSEARTRPTRVLVTHGALRHLGGELDGLALKLGDVIKIRDERTRIVLGVYSISAIVRADTGQSIGDVPDRLIRRCEA